ncbi:MAG: DUF5063 domain-containing protein [Dehalococcoidia bacterium]|nr:DUF5063 domain-containing protein [Dehalococcoidia bacterium]
MEQKTFTPDENLAAEEFVKLIRGYTTLVDNLSNFTTSAFLFECSKILPRLYLSAQELPYVSISDSYEGEDIGSPVSSIKEKLGKYDFYHDMIDPIVDKEIKYLPISDDLADIYVDLKSQLHNFEDVGEHRIYAIWEWKFGFQNHWGKHLLSTMKPIHWLLYKHMGLDYDVSDTQAVGT